MRLSQLFGKTLREAPADANTISAQLAARAGLIRRAGGVTAYLPLGQRVQQKIRQIVREELRAVAGQELVLPDPLPAQLFRSDIGSYRDLPRLVFDPSGKSAIAYSLCPNLEGLQAAFRNTYHTLLRVFEKCEVSIAAVEAGRETYAFVAPHEKGNESLLICNSRDCGYASLAAYAGQRLPEIAGDEPRPLEKVATPHCPTIAALADFLKIETRQTLKAVMYMRNEAEFVFVVIRGDLEVSEQKLITALAPLGNGTTLRPATEAEIVKVGAVPGYASPAGLQVAESLAERPSTAPLPGSAQGAPLVYVVADPSVSVGSNFAAGANEAGYHFINVNYPRDFKATVVTDIALAQEGALCARCGAETLRAQRAFLLGVCRNAGASSLTYLAENGKPQPVCLGEYRLDLEPLLLTLIEQHHDAAGIVWPAPVAPFDTHLVRLGKAPEIIAAADQLYADLQTAGRAVLYDDREESAGVKFTDADLIGVPLRVTVSDKSLKAGGVEVKRRESVERKVIEIEGLRSVF